MEFINSNCFPGKSFDHDRHGAQLRINRTGEKETRIGLFDNGAIHAQVHKKDGALAEPYITGREKEDDFKDALANGGHITVPAAKQGRKNLAG